MNIVQLKDGTGDKVYAVSHTNAIKVNGEQKTLTTKLANDTDIYNVTEHVPLDENEYYELSTAIGAVPTDIRKPGLVITYLNEDAIWKCYQYTSEDITNASWSNESNWGSFGGTSYITNSEEVSQMSDSLNIVKLKDDNDNDAYVVANSDGVKVKNEGTLTEALLNQKRLLIEELGVSSSSDDAPLDIMEGTHHLGYKVIYNETDHSFQVTSENADNGNKIFILKVKKWDIIRKVGNTTGGNRTVYFGFSQEPIVNIENVEDIVFDNAIKTSGNVFDDVVVAPYDGYMVHYYYTTTLNVLWNDVVWSKLNLSEIKDNTDDILYIINNVIGNGLINHFEDIDFDKTISGYYKEDETTHKVVLDTGSGSGNYRCVTLNVVEGETYEVTVNVLYAGLPVYYVYVSDDNMNILGKFIWRRDANVKELKTQLITIPTGATKLHVSHIRSGSSTNNYESVVFWKIRKVILTDTHKNALLNIVDSDDGILKSTVIAENISEGGYFLDCNPESPTYGEEVNLNSNIRTVRKVPLKGATYIGIQVLTGGASGFLNSGYMFYDSEDDIVDSKVTYIETISGYSSKYLIIKVPESATSVSYVQFWEWDNFRRCDLFYGEIVNEIELIKNDLEEIINNGSSNPNTPSSSSLYENYNYNIINQDSFKRKAKLQKEDETDFVENGEYCNSAYVTASDNGYVTCYKYCHKNDIIRLYGYTDPSYQKTRAIVFAMSETIPVIDETVCDHTLYYLFDALGTPRTIYYTIPYDGYFVYYYYDSSVWAKREFSIATGLKIVDNYLPLIKQAKFAKDTTTGVLESLGLLHYSDIHGDDDASNTILDYCYRYKDYIDEVVCTGDSVHGTVGNYSAISSDINNANTDWWHNCGLAEKSLFVLGNHDCAVQFGENDEIKYTLYDFAESNNIAWNGMGKSWAYENYFDYAFDPNDPTKTYITELGYLMPNEEGCYWYKDYDDQKIRIIGIDAMNRYDGELYFDSNGDITGGSGNFKNCGSSYAQEQWLIDTLNDATDHDLSVVFMCHWGLDDFSADNNETWDEDTHKWSYNLGAGRVMDYKTGYLSNFHNGSGSGTFGKEFNLRNRVGDSSQTYEYSKGIVNNIGNIIQNWIDNGGKYVVWLCGHTHCPYFYYPTNYPDMLVLTQDLAGSRRTSNIEYKEVGDPSSVCANYISINTSLGLLRIVRLGLNSNKLLTPMNYLCYDYINRKIVNEG